ncbi:hypothetical protein HK099_005956 [Clydaea vesicula]|uniref:Vacuolar sorting protein Vps3844 C-terminal domain-containing protein n=1 Tax=Clydaea vesicula TaxID=447962 RepID=A0AAD5Y0Z8_9FUNG|nr:hypothetical protein HK099_005956 [Clydaea vesicula]
MKLLNFSITCSLLFKFYLCALVDNEADFYLRHQLLLKQESLISDLPTKKPLRNLFAKTPKAVLLLNINNYQDASESFLKVDPATLLKITSATSKKFNTICYNKFELVNNCFNIIQSFDQVYIEDKSSFDTENLQKTVRELDSNLALGEKEVLNNFFAKFGVQENIFNLKISSDQYFVSEMEFVTSFFEAVKIQSIDTEPIIENYESVLPINYHFNLIGFEKLISIYGKNHEKVKVGQEVMKKAIEMITESFAKAYFNNVGIEFTTNIDESAKFLIQKKREFEKRELKLPSCAKDETTCFSRSSNCSFHGTCLQNKKNGCFECSCFKAPIKDAFGNSVPGQTANRTWGGSYCQLEDISTDFQLLFSSISLLFGVGKGEGIDGSSNAGKHPKVD